METVKPTKKRARMVERILGSYVTVCGVNVEFLGIGSGENLFYFFPLQKRCMMRLKKEERVCEIIDLFYVRWIALFVLRENWDGESR